MSIHKDCGANITWAKREHDDTRFMPPLEYAGQCYIIDSSGSAVQVHAFRLHQCDPVRAVAWQEYLLKMEEIKATQNTEPTPSDTYEHVKTFNREETWKIAFMVDCPYCLAPADVVCRNMSQKYRKSGENVSVNNPHPMRLKEAYKKLGFKSVV